MSTLGGGDRGRAGHRHPRAGERAGRRGQRAARGHEVVHEHHGGLRRGRWKGRGTTRVDPEPPDRGAAALDRRQPDRVRLRPGVAESRGDRRRDAGPAQRSGRRTGQPLHVLPTPEPRHSAAGGDRHQQHEGARSSPAPNDRQHGRRQRVAQHAGKVPPPALLEGQQGGADGPRIGAGDGDPRQARWTGVRPVRPRTRQGGPAARAERPPGAAAARTPARQEEIGEDVDHRPTVALGARPGKPPRQICGQRFCLWTTS